MVALCEIVIRQHASALHRASAAAPSAEPATIEAGTLDTLVPGRAWSA
jgi:hypothetical protein